MHTAHWKAHLLPLLLLLSLYSVSVCLADFCYYDENLRGIDPKTIPTANEQPAGKDWEHLRIVASTEDLQGPSRYCKGVDGSLYERGTKGPDDNCVAAVNTVTEQQKTILMGIVDRAITLHTDRLLVQRALGPLKIPDFSKHLYCDIFNVPAKHHTDGVAKADMVLYVASDHGLGGSDNDPALFGLTCAKSAGGRPIAGGLIIGKGNTEISRFTVRLAAHHIAHALGFSYNEMKSRNMIMDKTVRKKPNSVAVVKSDKTKEMAQAHYGCSSAEGMELEDGKENKKKLSHWERRNAKDELMAAPVGGRHILFMGFYTNLTMAAFEDMGFYKANFQMAEHMEYGHNAGCDFLTDKCLTKGVTKWPNMFCANSESDAWLDVCTTDRLGLGDCYLNSDYSSPLPEHFQYFTSPKEGGLILYLTDYCPVVEMAPFYACTNLEEVGKTPGVLYSKNSMCLDGSALQVQRSSGAFQLGGVCAEISCDGGSVKVKYDGDNDKWHDCPEGKSLTPSSTSTFFVSGKIKCPKYKEVCTVAPDGSSLVPKVIIESMEPSTSASPSASQDPKGSQKPTGKPNDPNSGGKSKDDSAAPFALIPSVAFFVLSFAGYLIA